MACITDSLELLRADGTTQVKPCDSILGLIRQGGEDGRSSYVGLNQALPMADDGGLGRSGHSHESMGKVRAMGLGPREIRRMVEAAGGGRGLS